MSATIPAISFSFAIIITITLLTLQSCSGIVHKLGGAFKYEPEIMKDQVSAMLQHNRLPEPMLEILKRPELHARLVNGTDYPLVAINALIRTSDLDKNGFITSQERKYLNEIYDYNPLLFEFVLKRTIKLPGAEQKLSPSIFFRNLFKD